MCAHISAYGKPGRRASLLGVLPARRAPPCQGLAPALRSALPTAARAQGTRGLLSAGEGGAGAALPCPLGSPSGAKRLSTQRGEPSGTMKQPGQLFFLRLLLLLCLPKIKCTAGSPSLVFNIQVTSLGTTELNLTWQINDTAASGYTYEIVIIPENDTHRAMNQTSQTTNAVIKELQPGTYYTFEIIPLERSNMTKEQSNTTSTYTKPSPVFNITPENISTDQVTLTWQNNDTAAPTYTYVIYTDGNEISPTKNQTSQNKSAVIVGLQPGTPYNFTIFPLATDNKTKGDSTSLHLYIFTKPSAVFDIKPESISTHQVTLTWENNDTAAPNYTYLIFTDGNGISPTRNQTSQNKSAVIVDLQPGTPYNFTIFPIEANNQTKGDANFTSIYTTPSSVFNIQVTNLGTTELNLTWQINDTAASLYTYEIIIIQENNISRTKMQTFQTTNAVIRKLQPGTHYTFEIFPLAAHNMTGGHTNITSTYTKPSAVFDIKPESISTHQVTLTWENNDTAAPNYTYLIFTDGNGISPTRNQTSQNKRAVIVDLQPGTPYNFTIFPIAADNQTKGDPNFTSIYTKPSAVFDIKPESISTHRVTLTWENNDTAASNYTYLIFTDGNGISPTRNQSSQNKRAVIVDLQPGTPYNFTIFPIAADNQTKGDPNFTSIYTKPSAVFDIKPESISTHQVTLTWENNDTAAPNYTYLIFTDGNGISARRNQTSQNKSAVIVDLQPGTPYNFTIFPLAADNQTEGNSTVRRIYTKPSPVLDLQVIYVSTTQMNLSWQNSDAAASEYTYKVITEGNGFQNETYRLDNTTFGATIRELSPGTPYTFMVFPQAGDKITEGKPTNVSNCTDAESVSSFNCTPAVKKPELELNWSCPNGNFSGFRINTFNDAWSNEAQFSSCNGIKSITNLNYSTSYSVNITTYSCGKDSHPVQRTCDTSITDPPAPVKEPSIASITHNSFKLAFSGFEPKNGPLKAYAIVITTAKEGNEPPNSSLSYTYNDFKEKKTNTYITYVLDAGQMSSSSFRSGSSQYELEVGNKTTIYGYYNAPLEPLGSYRACVAGFTKIAFTKGYYGLIVENGSYVSFTPYSQAISLPQDPGVIAGAVVGSILVALTVISVVGFVLWRQRRKDGKNNELSFSQIRPKKSKLIKVENFESYFKKQQADSNCGFAEEYEELRSVGVNQPKFAAELIENRGKNRYNNVLPYDISRVKLSIQNHPADDYINANYMPGYNFKKEFIAAQGPLPNTLQDFWRMIWEKNIYAIVMLTKCIEQGRTKCEEYWPDKGSMNYGDITVSLISEIVLPEWTIRDFTVEDNNATASHPVRQFHFTSWPDHGVPETTDLLINFRHLVQENMRQNPPESPTLVHCSAGVGRTGTFIAIDHLIQQMEMENTSDVYGVVYDLRMHRPLMVQTEDQYIFLNQCVLDIIKSQKDKISELIYQNTTAMAIYENFAPIPSYEMANGYHA
ncbi:receptor-type tyrosine-protein phosphatase eta [Emydura macquarii macquarii]|uniref:receptor-type tyrosine-protein phosphatase eta n=1 Tax=Emydura macquarii macquarii TaxID=1129001 RepID=UPI00352B638F